MEKKDASAKTARVWQEHEAIVSIQRGHALRLAAAIDGVDLAEGWVLNVETMEWQREKPA